MNELDLRHPWKIQALNFTSFAYRKIIKLFFRGKELTTTDFSLKFLGLSCELYLQWCLDCVALYGTLAKISKHPRVP